MVNTTRLGSQLLLTFMDVEILEIPAGATPKLISVRVLTSDGPAQYARWGGFPALSVGDTVTARRDPNDFDTLVVGELAGAVAPVGAQYLTLSTDANLTNERVLTPGDGLAGTDAGAGSTYTLAVNVDDATIEIPVDTLQVKADGINDTHIDWGVGANQVSAVDMPILDAGGYYGTDNVEAALAAIGAGTTLDARYLMLDASNDPMQGDLDFDDTYDIIGAVDGEFLGDVTVDGNVGIGVSPDTLLHLQKSFIGFTEVDMQKWGTQLATYNLRLANYNSAVGVDWRFILTNGGVTSNPITIQGDGAVGINNTNPQAQFDVDGDIIAGGDLTVDGTLIVGPAVTAAKGAVDIFAVSGTDVHISSLSQTVTGTENNSLVFNGLSNTNTNLELLRLKVISTNGGIALGNVEILQNGSATPTVTMSSGGEVTVQNDLTVDGELESGGGRIANTTRVTTTYTILVTDNVIFANTDGGAWTATLPVGVEGQTFKIINSGSSGNDLTIVPNGAEHLIGTNSGFTVSDGESEILTYNATDGWY